MRVSPWLAVAVLLGSAQAGWAQQSTLGPKDGAGLLPTEIERVKVGDVAPDFTLESFEGPAVTLSEFRGRKNVVLVFYRGHWCPYCASQLVALKDLLDAKRKVDTEILAVSIDPRPDMRKMIDRVSQDDRPFELTLLSDPGHRVIDRYGLLNPNGRGGTIPHPATLVIDKRGIVRWKFVETNYKVRPTNQQIIEALAKLGGP